jgi:hypothetical protein
MHVSHDDAELIDATRAFMVRFLLRDDTVEIYEPPVRKAESSVESSCSACVT